MGEEPNHMTSRKPGPLLIIQCSLMLTVVYEEKQTVSALEIIYYPPPASTRTKLSIRQPPPPPPPSQAGQGGGGKGSERGKRELRGMRTERGGKMRVKGGMVK